MNRDGQAIFHQADRDGFIEPGAGQGLADGRLDPLAGARGALETATGWSSGI